MTDFQDNTVNPAATQALPPSVPVYQQTRELVCQLIVQLQAQGKQRLPAERELAARVNCHRLSLRDALTRLENEGLIYRLNRSGWYITPPRIQYNPSKIISFHEYVAQQGRVAHTEVLSLSLVPAGEDYARVLALASASDQVWQIERRRLIDGHPVMLEQNVISHAWCPQLDIQIASGSITGYIANQYQHHLLHSDVEIESITLEEATAEKIRARAGITATRLTRLSLSAAGNPVEFDTELWRADAVKISLRI